MTPTEQDELIAVLTRLTEAQTAALKHWRAEADRDAGTLKRYYQALFDIAHGFDSDAALRERARKELEDGVSPTATPPPHEYPTPCPCPACQNKRKTEIAL